MDAHWYKFLHRIQQNWLNSVRKIIIFVFLLKGDKFTYTNWGKGQPDNAHFNEHCVEWVNYRENWNDRDCNHHQGVICETRCGSKKGGKKG